MNGHSFLDTNVLCHTDDPSSPTERRRALDLIAECTRRRTGVISTQVLQEYFVTVTRKFGVAAEIARGKTEVFSRLRVVKLGTEEILAAIDLHRLHSISFWDALIVRAALASGCVRLYSEDMQPGRRFNGLEIVNPFQ